MQTSNTSDTLKTNILKPRRRLRLARSRTEKIVFAVVFVIFMLYSLALLYPFAFAFNASLMENGRAYTNNSVSIPWPMHFDNYLKAFKELEIRDNNFVQMLLNSLWYSFGCTFCEILTSACTAYVVCKYKFRLSGLLYGIAVFIQIIPIYGSLPSAFLLYTKLGLVDSPLYVICSMSGFGFAFIILYSFFKGLSWTYAEAAFVDGASHFRVLFTIMLPMAIPAITAMAVMNFIGLWNDYSTPLLFFPNLPTLSSGVWEYEREMQFQANQPVYYAGVLISLVPILALFLGFQNTIMQNLATGGLKG